MEGRTDSMESMRGGSFASLAETVRQADVLYRDTVEVPPGEEAGDLRWSLIDSVPTSPSSPPTRPSITSPLPVEVDEVPVSEMEAIQSLKDKLQAVLNARHALVATSPRHTQTAAQTSPTSAHSAPTFTSRRPSLKDIWEESAKSVMSVEDIWEAELRSVSSSRAWWQQAPVQRPPDNTPKNAESVGDHRRSAGDSCMMAMATPARAPAFTAACTPLPAEMQNPCLFCPPVVPATRANLYGRQVGRHGWSEAPVCSSVRGIEDDSSPVDPRVVGGRRALPPRLTPLDPRHQCPSLFLSHTAPGPRCYDV